MCKAVDWVQRNQQWLNVIADFRLLEGKNYALNFPSPPLACSSYLFSHIGKLEKALTRQFLKRWYS